VKDYYVTGIKPVGYKVIRRTDGAAVATSTDYRAALAAARDLNGRVPRAS